ncbi:MAG: SulP family inorganic anion transporter [Bryobacteraceae bacterium]|nr:SulP family inorganic anion transporter [Bryobacteraceae bacterium]
MLLERLKSFNRVIDDRFEDLTRETWKSTVYRDFSAGLVTAMTAIPMAMGFAMAMGLRPEQGIIAGAVACAVGRTWGGSKYQVYGPTAAFIPIIYAVTQKYDHGFLILGSIIAGIILLMMGLGGLGKVAKLVPNSIVVGFTVGIGVTIAATNLYDVMGINAASNGNLLTKLSGVAENFGMVNGFALAIGLSTFLVTKGLLKVSIFIPAPLIAVGAATAVSATLWSEKGLTLIRSKYGEIPTNFFVFTPPSMPQMNAEVAMDLAYLVLGIVFVSGIESLLCSSMADRMAGNRKTPFNPDKEFWGQGMVQIITPLINGFPCTGALARTATSIKAGAVTPLAGYFKFALKLAMAYYLATWLELVPMACIGGILLWVASNMIKVAEIKHVLATTKFHAGLMIYTAVMVPMTDFLTGVLSALAIYAVLRRFFEPASEQPGQSEEAVQLAA